MYFTRLCLSLSRLCGTPLAYTTYLRGPSVVARVSAGLPFCWVSAAESASAVERGTFSALTSALASDGSTLEAAACARLYSEKPTTPASAMP